MPPLFIEDYRQWAEECDRLAEIVASPRVRKMMLYVALQWRALADREEAKVTRVVMPPPDLLSR